MRYESKLDVKEMERELAAFVAHRFAIAELAEGSMHLSAFDEDANEIPQALLAERLDRAAEEGRPADMQPGNEHYAQLRVSGPPRDSGVVDGLFELLAADWMYQAQAAGPKRGQDPTRHVPKRLIIADGAHRFVHGLRRQRKARGWVAA